MTYWKGKLMDYRTYEELYRERWEKQNIIDKAINPKLELAYKRAKRDDLNKINGKLGGRPKMPLSKDAEMLDKLLKKELSLKDAADIMSITVDKLRGIKKRYRLPRHESD